MSFTSELLHYLSNVFFNTENDQEVSNYIQNISNAKISKIFISNDLSIIKDIDTSITFWFENNDSLYDKIELIKNHPIKSHIFMINNFKYQEKIEKIKEINKNYILKMVKNVLVAYVPLKVCMVRYISKCRTNPQSPGFTDFLRGTVSLYQYSKKYGYDLYIDANIHPIFKYFKNNEHYWYTPVKNSILEVNEMITPPHLHPNIAYKMIDEGIRNMFQTSNSFMVISNAFYRNNREDKDIINFNGNLNDQETKKFIQNILIPGDELNKSIDNVFNNVYNIPRKSNYKTIHLRVGDNYIHNPNYINDYEYNKWYEIMKNIFDNDQESEYILLTDSSSMGKRWKMDLPRLKYWDNNKNHLGDLKNGEENVLDTLTDLMIMRESSEIISNGSGFSRMILTIFDIPCRRID